MKEANKKRILWIDYAKAFAMFFVVFDELDILFSYAFVFLFIRNYAKSI